MSDEHRTVAGFHSLRRFCTLFSFFSGFCIFSHSSKGCNIFRTEEIKGFEIERFVKDFSAIMNEERVKRSAHGGKDLYKIFA